MKKCKYCKVELKIGDTLDSKEDPNIRVEYVGYDEGKLTKCWKCPTRGYSESIYEKI